ncbi:glutamate 5-kinase [Paracoccaceae bacterium]|nr:glutamate 5-kinase [Paracoccaceae bacterium]
MEPNLIKISPDRKKIFQQSTSIVVKVGSSLLVEDKLGAIKKKWFASFIEDIIGLRKLGKTVIIVSSGAINLGRKILNLKDNDLTLEQEQAAASVGQIELSKEYQEHFKFKGFICSQVLITLDDFTNRRRYLNCKSTLKTLLNLGVIPIVNENDTVATDEIRYGDNDRLAAQVASICDSDLLILLSDIDGLYTESPKKSKNAAHIPFISEITEEIELMAKGPENDFSHGGMKTKIEAAKVTTSVGCNLIIADGKKNFPIRDIAENKATWFLASQSVKAARKKWILNMKSLGEIIIDFKAEKALKSGKSLLPVGATKCIGQFSRGDVVAVRGEDGQILAKGLTSFNQVETEKILGIKSEDIPKVLGYNRKPELIHRDNMAFFN